MTKLNVKQEENIVPNLGEMLAEIGYALSKLNAKDRKKLVDEVIMLSEKKFKKY